MRGEPFERRDVLALLASAGGVSVAGCLDLELGDGGAARADDAPLFSQWMPASGGRDSMWITATYVDVAEVRRFEESLPESKSAELTSFLREDIVLEPLGISPESVDQVLRFLEDVPLVLSGTFDESAIDDALESQSFEERDEYGEYDVFREVRVADDERYTIAVDSSTVLLTLSEATIASGNVYPDERDGADDDDRDADTNAAAPVTIEQLIDTGAGVRDRLQNVNDDVGALLDTVDAPTTLNLGVLREIDFVLDGWIGYAFTVSIADERVTQRGIFLFEDESAVDEAGVEGIVRADDVFDSPDDLTIESTGRIAIAEATVATEEFDPSEKSRDTASPQAGVQISRSDDSVTVTKNTIERADEITTLHNGEVVEVFEDPEVGDSVTVDASSGDTIAVVASYGGTESIIVAEEVRVRRRLLGDRTGPVRTAGTDRIAPGQVERVGLSLATGNERSTIRV